MMKDLCQIKYKKNWELKNSQCHASRYALIFLYFQYDAVECTKLFQEFPSKKLLRASGGYDQFLVSFMKLIKEEKTAGDIPIWN